MPENRNSEAERAGQLLFRVVESMEVMASSPSEQKNWLYEEGTKSNIGTLPVFEIVDDFSNWILALKPIANYSSLSEAAAAELWKVDDLVNKMYDLQDEDLWTLEGLDNRSEWKQLRQMSASFLNRKRTEFTNVGM